MRAEAAQASSEAVDSALLAIEDGRALLASGEEALALCAEALGVEAPDPQAVLNALMRADPDHARRLRALTERGEACAFEVQGSGGLVAVEGRGEGSIKLRSTPLSSQGSRSARGLPRLRRRT